MIPSVVARQVRETVLDYLRTTFALSDAGFEAALFEFLDGEEGLFRGPYIDVRLPFRKSSGEERVPLEIRPGFDPYKHQLKAFQRLYSRGGHQPQHTLVTTGTGSGKTECFLYPILDHCWRQRETPGVKAILLYPMNALASDQARRLAQTLWEDERLRGQVTAGLYVGGNGQHGVADGEHLVDKREVLRDSPPDILLTNYKMLDFLLLRPSDRRLWRHNGPDTLRYLVLDELHTYDGAQGSDVACLIRRLKCRLGCAPGSVCSVGTSATIGGTMRGETIRALTDFASKVFDQDFFEDSVITEERCVATETLGSVVDLDRFPRLEDAGDLDPERFADAGAWMRRQAELWFGEDGGELTPVEVGKRIERHDFLRQILKVLDGQPRSWSQLDAALQPRVPEIEAFDAQGRQRLFESFLALVSHARRPAPAQGKPDRMEPLLTVQAHLWLRELRRLVCKVQSRSEPPVFAWADDSGRRDPEVLGHWLPIAHCRECGAAGMATFQRESEPMLQTDLQGIGRSWFGRYSSCRHVAFGHEGQVEGFPEYLCPQCLRVQWGKEQEVCDQCRVDRGDGTGSDPVPLIPVRIGSECSEKTPPKYLASCPDCGSNDALSMLGSRAPSLLSVAISHLFHSDFNDDKKLLAFTDSVQDASHRAGFFGARTYRFTLRTAIQKVVDESGDAGILLAELGDRVWSYWQERIDQDRLIPTLLPADLRELPEYLRFLEKGGSGSHRKLVDQLRQRLSWEAVLEYGLNSRKGRTLQSTLCSVAEVDPQALGKAAEILELELRENHPLASAPVGGIARGDLEHFLAGVLHRVLARGGVEHPLLRSYVREGGNHFLLAKRKQPLMSPFGRESVLPRFLTDRAPVSGETPVFDTFISRPDRQTWFRDWASRALGIDRKDEGMHDLYREALRRLEDAGLLTRHDLRRKGQAWGIRPEMLRVGSRVAVMGCSQCSQRIPLAGATAKRWAGRRCPRYRCQGTLRVLPEEQQTYYARVYRSGRLQRIYSHEHTGLLGRAVRERLEEDFKEGTKPGAPNLFVCTPTLEMGIDIGDLSATVHCSVPPTTANFLQRTGRAGRKTGNAFGLTLANSRPHDLYFQAQPLEMMAGQVLPPGCFLDAPEMLRRQLVAHAMDAWARQDEKVTRIPSQTGHVLGETGSKAFPGRFIEFYREHREALTQEFLTSFGQYLSSVNREKLIEFAQGDLVPESILGAFDRVRTELKELRNDQQKVKKRLRDIENNPEIVDDPEVEKRELEDTRRLLGRLSAEIRQKYPLNVLTDEGVLPNYAFPEPGVKLESLVSQVKEGGQREYRASEYMRPASSAIRELAPFNTFYADGRKVRIDEIDIGSKARPLIEAWRLCQECSYMRREDATRPVESECPRCGDLGWSDAGQVRQLVHFRRSRSLVPRLESSTVDDTDDREEAFYQLLDLIDVGAEHYSGAKLIDELPFGYELLRNLKLREVNFGPSDRAQQHGLKVCGMPVGNNGFEVCTDCGRVRKPGGDCYHVPSCRARRSGYQERMASLFLYREVQSEAIRILLPVSEVELESKRASFKAALQLGFRRHFEGDPGHLIIRSVREPIPGGYGTRQYLVIFDGVPGGTGYLSDLWQEDHFLAVLEKALSALQSCACQQDPQRDGCYRCLFAYQSQRELPLISSREAQEILRAILEKRDQLRPVRTLSDVTLETKLESELETKFLKALQDRAKKSTGMEWEEKVRGGQVSWLLRVEGRAWEIQTQVDLRAAQGVSPACRPDFLIRPASADPAIKPIAVFCDGLAYHACPGREQGRIADDILKRGGILASGRYAVWSVTWKDVEDFQNSHSKSTAPSLFEKLNQGQLGRIGGCLGLELSRSVGMLGSMQMLLAFIEAPQSAQWEILARVYASGWLTASDQWIAPEAGASLEARLESDPDRFQPGPMAQVGSEAPVLTRYVGTEWQATLGRSTRDALRTGNVERMLLRLFDDAEARSARTFEADWRGFLQAWNLLQFLEGTEAVSSELIVDGRWYGEQAKQEEAQAAEAASAEATSPDAKSAEAAAGRRSAKFEAEVAALLEVATEASRDVILRIADEGLPLPQDEYELETPGAGCGPQPELAWPDLKVAVLGARQAEDAPLFEAAGWTVQVHPVDVDRLLAELRRALGR